MSADVFQMREANRAKGFAAIGSAGAKYAIDNSEYCFEFSHPNFRGSSTKIIQRLSSFSVSAPNYVYYG